MFVAAAAAAAADDDDDGAAAAAVAADAAAATVAVLHSVEIFLVHISIAVVACGLWLVLSFHFAIGLGLLGQAQQMQQLCKYLCASKSKKAKKKKMPANC